MRSKLTCSIASAALGVLTLAAPASARTHSMCGAKHGEAYIICKETGGEPARYAHGEPHPGPSSAHGEYGLLRSTEAAYGSAYGYMRARYGSWAAAEAHHRAHNWW